MHVLKCCTFSSGARSLVRHDLEVQVILRYTFQDSLFSRGMFGSCRVRIVFERSFWDSALTHGRPAHNDVLSGTCALWCLGVIELTNTDTDVGVGTVAWGLKTKSKLHVPPPFREGDSPVTQYGSSECMRLHRGNVVEYVKCSLLNAQVSTMFGLLGG